MRDNPQTAEKTECIVRSTALGFSLSPLHSRLSTLDSPLSPLPSPLPPLSSSAILLLCLLLAVPAAAMDQVTVRREGKTVEVTGRVLVTAKDGGLLLLARDGVLWVVPPAEQVAHTSDSQDFEPYTRDELSKRLLAELPPGFKVQRTTHYLICYDTSPAYAQWCGSLFERLYMAFTNFWSRRGFDLVPPEFPLMAVVFADRDSYLKHSRAELGDAGESIIGYFNLNTNRMTMYDLTGMEAQGRGSARGKTAAQINQILAQPDALRTVATIVHEATHQIAFNCGLHARLSDCPLWFCEGIAMFFETPDLRSAKGWSGAGAVNQPVNQPRLERFRQYLGTRPANSLETLIRDGKRFRDPKQAVDAYAEAWALTYFLIRQHPKAYVAYLGMLSKKTPLMEDGSEKRVEQFRQFFGDLKSLDAEFLRYTSRLR
jgi:hypothetical protein